MVNKIKLFKTIFFAIAGNGFFYFEFTYSGLESNITADEEFGTAEFNDPQLAMMMIPGFLRKKALKNFLMKNSSSDSIGIKRNGQFCVFDDQNKDDQNIIYKIDINENDTIYGRYLFGANEWQKLVLVKSRRTDQKPFYKLPFELISVTNQEPFVDSMTDEQYIAQFTVIMISGFLRKKALKNFLMKNSDSDSIGIKRNGQFCVFDDQNKDDQNIIYKIDIKNDNTIYARYDSKWQELNLNEKHHFLFNL